MRMLIVLLLIWIGGQSNTYVMRLNHGKMPVRHWKYGVNIEIQPNDHVHVWMTPETRAKILCDWIILVPNMYVASPGDIPIIFGFFYIWFSFWRWIGGLLWQITMR